VTSIVGKTTASSSGIRRRVAIAIAFVAAYAW
jgi:hypothetical protein